MKNKNVIMKSIFVLSFIMLAFNKIDVHATSSLEKKQQETIEKIEELKDAKKKTDNKTNELKKESNKIETTINELDKKSDSAANEIAVLENKIDNKISEIETKESEIEKLQEKLDSQFADMKKRIQYMYENGVSVSYIMTLISDDDVSGLLTKMDFFKTIADYDRQMFNDYKATKKAVESEKDELEKEKENLNELKEKNESKKKELDTLINQKSSELNSYKQKINASNQESAKYEAEILKQEKALELIEMKIAAAAAKNDATGEFTPSSSGMIWPCPSSKRITSYFGPRKAPVAGASTNHKGIDIGAASGSAIVAVSSGKVTTATYSSSAGNYIVISHGNGLSSVYMHCSKLYVSVGQVVSQGETIAAVGSTGYSTGPHLHFGIIKGGDYVNPLNYI